MRLTLVTHSTVAIETDDGVVLTDPVLRGHVTFLRQTAAHPPPGLTRQVRAVLVSHLHHDHCDLPSLNRIGTSVPLLVPTGTDQFFRRRGFTDVRPMKAGDQQRVRDIAISATPAAHDGRRHPIGSPASSLGFVVTAGGISVYFAGDTDLFPEMRFLAGELDVALLPVAGWGRSLGPGHLDAARAAQAAGLLAPVVAVPIHWDGLRPFWHRRRTPDEALLAPHAFLAETRRLGLSTRVEIVPPGGSIVVAAG